MTKEHEELKCSHNDLVQQYDSILIEQRNNDMLSNSHSELVDDHFMLNIAHEVVFANLNSCEPHSCNCTHSNCISPCSNPRSLKESQSLIEQQVVGSKKIAWEQETKTTKEKTPCSTSSRYLRTRGEET
jgi:hypothetical protein